MATPAAVELIQRRLKEERIPEAPLTHHWLDSTHITFGVVTLGATTRDWKLEASAFNGREPDQHRWNIETGPLDSWSARLSWNPGENWSLQASHGKLKSPEQLEPDEDVTRTTASVGRSQGAWSTMAAAGVNWVVNQTYDEGEPALLEAVKLCHELGMDVNATNSMGLTALMGAANRGSDSIIEFLVSKGARLDTKDNEGRTAYDWAEGEFLATHAPVPKPTSMALIQELSAAERK